MQSAPPIFLDYGSTTPLDPRVWRYITPFFTEHIGNPSSSTHLYGKKASQELTIASQRVARLLDVNPEDLIFTSGATEAINLAIKGAFEAYRSKGNHIISAKTEHKAVLDCLESLKSKGARVSFLETDQEGNILLSELEKTIGSDTILVCLMWGNNETGHLHPVKSIGEICRNNGVLYFADATQAVGKIPVCPLEHNVDLLALSSHKFYGPKGAGALYTSSCNPRVKITPQIHGGGQQNGMRGGTINLPCLAGMGMAAEIAASELEKESGFLSEMRNYFEKGILARIDGLRINGAKTERLPHISNFSIKGIPSSTLLEKLSSEIALSKGSACNSGSGRPSHVLEAMGVGKQWSETAIRLSVGRFTTQTELNSAITIIASTVEEIKSPQ